MGTRGKEGREQRHPEGPPTRRAGSPSRQPYETLALARTLGTQAFTQYVARRAVMAGIQRQNATAARCLAAVGLEVAQRPRDR